MLEFIKDKNIILAIIIRKDYTNKKNIFFTEDNSNFQVGYFNRDENSQVKPHFHKLQERVLNTTSEVLYIKSGKIKITFYDLSLKKLENKILEQNDIVVFLCGGHGINFIEKTELIEVKQGPYIEFNDKEYI